MGRTARAGKAGRAVTLLSDSMDDRKLIKLAAKTIQRSISASSSLATSEEAVQVLSVDSIATNVLSAEIDALKDEIQEILREEKEEKEIRSTEMQIKKGQNLLDHREQIMARPARTWFQSGKEKSQAKERGGKEWHDKMGDGVVQVREKIINLLLSLRWI